MVDHPLLTGPIPRLEDVAVPIMAPVADGPADIIAGLVPRQGQLVIAGTTNVGKTLTALEIVSAIATGQPLWGQMQPTLQAKRVLYILAEHYREVVQRLWQVTKLPMTDQVFIIGPEQLSYDKWLIQSGKPNLVAIEKMKKWAEGVDLIVFDPLAAFVSGAESENDNITMRLVLDMMSLVAQTSGASSIILAHQGKPMMDKFGQEHARKSYAIRGGSAIEDAATNIFYLDKADLTPSQQAAGGAIYELRCRKYKGEAPNEFRLLRDPVTLTHSLLGNKPFVEVQKLDAQGKVARLQAENPRMDFRTAARLVAAMEGLPAETVFRRLGVKDFQPEIPEITE